MNEEKISKLIKIIRKENNLTQNEFAEKLGVTYQAVSKWENGKSIPDILTLKEISKMYDIDINDLLDGKNTKRKRSKLLIILIAIIILCVIIIIFIYNKNDSFEFKKISSKCSTFETNGIVAYNKNKTSLSINQINFCGEKDDKVYEYLSCELYEEDKSSKKKIASCKSAKNKTLEEYLKGVEISVDNYKSICKNFNDTNMYIEIRVKENGNEHIHKVPLKLDKNCR